MGDGRYGLFDGKPLHPNISRNGKLVAQSISLEGRSAFLPVEAEDGGFTVSVVKYGNPLPVVPCGVLSFGEAEAEALKQNEAAGIPAEVWWAIAERLKNADV